MESEKLTSPLSSSGDLPESTFSGRLLLLKGEHESESKFAQRCKIPLSSMRKYLAGSLPGIDKAAVIATALDVPLLWLATGEGKIRPGDEPSSPADDNEKEVESEFALIPGYSIQVSAGAGVLPDNEEPSRKLAFRRRWLSFRGLKEKDLVLVFAKGDSMEPTISDNNTLMIDTSQRELIDGSIYVIRTDHHPIVKRVQQLWNKGILLLSDNKEYKEQLVTPSEADDLEVIGRVVWVGKDL